MSAGPSSTLERGVIVPKGMKGFQPGENGWPPGERGERNPGGRPFGAKGKRESNAQQIVLMAANLIGGHEELARWYKADDKNKLVFWRDILPRLLPKVVEGEVATTQQRVVEHFLIHPDGRIMDPALLDLEMDEGGSEH